MIIVAFLMVQTRSMTKQLTQLGIFTCFSSLEPKRRFRKKVSIDSTDVITLPERISSFQISGVTDSIFARILLLIMVIQNFVLRFFSRLMNLCTYIPVSLGVLGGVHSIYVLYQSFANQSELLEVMVLKRSHV